jgi:hypothetical protein
MVIKKKNKAEKQRSRVEEKKNLSQGNLHLCMNIIVSSLKKLIYIINSNKFYNTPLHLSVSASLH